MIGKNLGEIRTRKKRDHTVGYCATFCGLRSGGTCDLSPSLTYNDWAPSNERGHRIKTLQLWFSHQNLASSCGSSFIDMVGFVHRSTNLQAGSLPMIIPHSLRVAFFVALRLSHVIFFHFWCDVRCTPPDKSGIGWNRCIPYLCLQIMFQT